MAGIYIKSGSLRHQAMSVTSTWYHSIDVMLVLLIIFMVTAPMLLQGEVRTPQVAVRSGLRLVISLTQRSLLSGSVIMKPAFGVEQIAPGSPQGISPTPESGFW